MPAGWRPTTIKGLTSLLGKEITIRNETKGVVTTAVLVKDNFTYQGSPGFYAGSVQVPVRYVKAIYSDEVVLMNNPRMDNNRRSIAGGNGK
jgi:hypothetical protein